MKDETYMLKIVKEIEVASILESEYTLSTNNSKNIPDANRIFYWIVINNNNGECIDGFSKYKWSAEKNVERILKLMYPNDEWSVST